MSASRTQGVNRESFKAIAAKWISLGDDPRTAIGVIVALKEASRDPRMQGLLQARIDRLKAVLVLRRAAERYQRELGEPLTELSQLVQRGYLESIPSDPFQFGYDIDETGLVQLRSGPKK
jgi:hypothetical protein